MAFSNAGHVFTHMLTILYATAVLYLPSKFDLSYGEMLGLSSVGLILFGVGLVFLQHSPAWQRIPPVCLSGCH